MDKLLECRDLAVKLAVDSGDVSVVNGVVVKGWPQLTTSERLQFMSIASQIMTVTAINEHAAHLSNEIDSLRSHLGMVLDR